MSVLSHSSAVSFAGVNIGQLVGINASPGSAVTVDTTGVEAVVVGVGANSRVRKTVDAVAIEPGTVSVRLLGVPPFQEFQIGQKGTLVVSTPNGSLIGEAILTTFDTEATVGELLRGSASFQFTGAIPQ